MKKLALIACSSRKTTYPTQALELYRGALFGKARGWAQIYCDQVAILSAKHHLVLPAQILRPYDVTLRTFTRAEKVTWGRQVARELRMLFPPLEFELVFLAGAQYVWPIMEAPLMLSYKFHQPLVGLPIGRAMQWLDGQMPVAA